MRKRGMMKPGKSQSPWRAIETLANVGSLGLLTDGQLLDHFRDCRDASGEDAFRVLVERHGPMVLGLCQRLVSDPHEAEDAFQATFLVLVHRAESIRKRETIGPWLCGVAGRVARRARARALRRRSCESGMPELAVPERAAARSSSGEAVILDEIARLPEAFRSPVVLCCLEGESYEAAARRLGVTEATVRGRLHRARKCLAAKLRSRGILAKAATLASDRLTMNPPLLPAPLLASTVQFAARWSSVRGLIAGAPAIPESVSILAQGVATAMIFQTVKISAIVVLVTAGVLGTVVIAQNHGGAQPGAAGPGGAAVGSPQNRPQPGAAPSTQAAAPGGGFDREQRTKQLLAALEEPIAMSFANETPLDDVLKYIKQATTTATYPGIPIYVEPKGLADAKATIQSTVQIDREGVPLRITLNQALRPLGLSYIVKDGLLMIDSRANVTELRLEEVDHKLDRVLDALQRIEGRR
jgi:RNA polymerase sigma factor (sigma-70 family)